MRVLSLALTLIPAVVLAQGTVDFNNNRTFQTPAERRIFYPDMVTPLVGTNYVAQLYYGIDASSLVPVTSAPARFRAPGTTEPGTWSGGNRTLMGFTSGMTAVMVVKIWDSNYGSLDQARAAGGFWGESSLFTYTVPASGSPPQAFYIENFRAFVMIPEPSVIALGCFGLAAFAFFRRRKR